MPTRRQTIVRATDQETYRSKDGTLVWAYWIPEGIELWFNDGPPMTHKLITEEQLEHAVMTKQLLSHDPEGTA